MLKLIFSTAFLVAATAYAVSVSSSTARVTCPGQVVCPLTGELVCQDRCPLGDVQSEEKSALPSCCQASKGSE